MRKGQKWYVVWKGRRVGVFDNWDDCRAQVIGFDGAQFKSYTSRDLAREAYDAGYDRGHTAKPAVDPVSLSGDDAPIWQSVSVDAACAGNPGVMEYRGVLTWSKAEIFHAGPFPEGTNNIGEFLAIVHALALLKKLNSALPLYTDSTIAISWVRRGKCRTRLLPNELNAPLFDLIKRAETWLRDNTYTTRIVKWETRRWLEIPADFGRK